MAADIRSLHDEQGVAWGSVGILMRATSRLSTFVEALRAAVNPAPGEALYFVSRGDGSHVFSTTLQEHNAAVRTHQLKQ